MPGNADIRDGMALARIEYLFGTHTNGGVPQRNRKILLELSCAKSEGTLARHIQTWERESELMARSAAECVTGLSISETTFEAHRHDTEWLRTKMDEEKTTVDGLEELSEAQWDMIDSLRENLMFTADDLEKVLRLVESYYRSLGSRDAALKRFLALQSRWQESSGMAGTLAAASAQLRETAKIKAKQAAHAAEGDGGMEDRTPKDAGERAKGNALFKRG